MLKAAEARVAASQSAWRESIATFKRELILRALNQTAGNRTRAARDLGIQRTYLLRLIREMKLAAPRGARNESKPGLKGSM